LLSASADATVRRWDIRSGREVDHPYTGHTGEVLAAAYSPDGEWIASGGGDRTIRVWRAASRQEALVLRGHTASVIGLHFSADGRRLVSLGADGTARLWETETRGRLPVLSGHTSYVYP